MIPTGKRLRFADHLLWHDVMARQWHDPLAEGTTPRLDQIVSATVTVAVLAI